MKKIYVIKTKNTVPYRNLALEEALLESVKPDECILYLWQNRQTVVIGRNQNALNECRIQKLESDSGFLARRLSGGGAVYHDLGNLNFTFIACADSFDKARQTDVILKAVRAVGINAEKNGRNDLTVDGRKFSGHAYYQTKNQCYHHGTIMLYVDKNRLSEYLNVSELKLKSKGVKSVRSRVVNLCELKPELNIQDLSDQLVRAFGEVYGLPVSFLDENSIDSELLNRLEARYSSPEWKYAGEKILSDSMESRFDWGQARLDYELTNAEFSEVQFYSDGLEAEYLSEISERLTGCPLKKSALAAKLTENITDRGWNVDAVKIIAENLVSMISENITEVTT